MGDYWGDEYFEYDSDPYPDNPYFDSPEYRLEQKEYGSREDELPFDGMTGEQRLQWNRNRPWPWFRASQRIRDDLEADRDALLRSDPQLVLQRLNLREQILDEIPARRREVYWLVREMIRARGGDPNNEQLIAQFIDTHF